MSDNDSKPDAAGQVVRAAAPVDGAREAVRLDVSAVLPVVNERDNLVVLIPRLKGLLEREGLNYEILVVDGGSRDGTREESTRLGAQVIDEGRPGYAGAIESGFAAARGQYVLILDADQSHEPDFISKMWRARTTADIVIASRFVRGGAAYGSRIRIGLSRILNRALRRLLSMPVQDLSSGFRLYRRDAVEGITLESRNFEVQVELAVKAYSRGASLVEVPFTYFPRGSGRSHARVLRFGLDMFRAAFKLWRLRNSTESADYDERAFYSIIPIQRMWHRSRHRIITSWARAAGRTLDAGCGSSVIVQSINNVVGMDFSLKKLRFLRRYQLPLVNGAAEALPFRDGSFDCVISAEVIEHLPFDEVLFSEMRRVLRPDGILITGTPDYATLGWRIIEPIYGLLMPGGYKDEHITHYTHQSLAAILNRFGFVIEEFEYVGGSDLTMRCRLSGRSVRPAVPASTGAGQTAPV
jgi:dolichol-phosphate mannosyltransferase